MSVVRRSLAVVAVVVEGGKGTSACSWDGASRDAEGGGEEPTRSRSSRVLPLLGGRLVHVCVRARMPSFGARCSACMANGGAHPRGPSGLDALAEAVASRHGVVSGGDGRCSVQFYATAYLAVMLSRTPPTCSAYWDLGATSGTLPQDPFWKVGSLQLAGKGNSGSRKGSTKGSRSAILVLSHSARRSEEPV